MPYCLNNVGFTLLLALSIQASASELPLDKSDCEFSGTFAQSKFIDGLDTPLNSTGQFYHHCNYGVIWSTLEPIEQTLVMQKAGKGFLIDQSGTKKLSSRQAKFLNKLLNDLMGADQQLLAKQFEITSIDKNHFQLLPITRKLKRGVKQIELLFSDASLTIDVIDRNSQRTEIITKQTRSFNIESQRENTEENCDTLLSEPSCSLLFNTSIVGSNLENAAKNGN